MENNKSVTAVEWLVEQYEKAFTLKVNNVMISIIEQAKEMERQQIIEAFDEGKSDGYKTAREWDEMIIFLNAEQYYIETYGKD